MKVLILIVTMLFVCGLIGLGWYAFFAPKYENVGRNVFEQTKSYTHGKVQDLAKHYQEYNKPGADKEVIKEFVIMRFAEFDANHIKPKKLRKFLVSLRGY